MIIQTRREKPERCCCSYRRRCRQRTPRSKQRARGRCDSNQPSRPQRTNKKRDETQAGAVSVLKIVMLVVVSEKFMDGSHKRQELGAEVAAHLSKRMSTVHNKTSGPVSMVLGSTEKLGEGVLDESRQVVEETTEFVKKAQEKELNDNVCVLIRPTMENKGNGTEGRGKGSEMEKQLVWCNCGGVVHPRRLSLLCPQHGRKQR